MKKQIGPKTLLIDIETAPLLVSAWGLFDQNIALNQIEEDWSILSYAAKWLDSPDKDIIYEDNRKAKNKRNDSKLLPGIWELLDQADVVVGHNSKRFDVKKLNARFIQNGLKPPSSYKQTDTLSLARKSFAFTSNKLEHLSDKLCKKYKKLKHKKFPGFDLWKECLKGNNKAWEEMEKYNKQDVLALQDLYKELLPWGDTSVNFNAYHDGVTNYCRCGSSKFHKNGFHFTSRGKYQRYKCIKCSSEMKDSKNLFSKEKKSSLKTNTR